MRNFFQFTVFGMHIKNLKVRNYRNYESFDLDFDRKLNLIIGDNAEGKTNLLESIYYISTGKSHRGAKQDELVRLNEDSAIIRALIMESDETVDDRGREHLLEIELGRTGLNNSGSPGRASNIKIRIDRAPYKKKSDFVSILPSVIFSPDDLKIIKGGPSDKRDFLDSINEKIFRDYQPLYLKYLKILNQRNSLLKSISNEDRSNKNPTLQVWNENLIRYGSEIIIKRLQLVADIRPLFVDMLGRFFSEMKAEILYIFSWDRMEPDNFSENNGGEYTTYLKNLEFSDHKNISLRFGTSLRENFYKELNYKTTLTGPHRDCFVVLLDGRDIKSFGSQGQQRVASVCLRLSELEILKKMLNKNPVLLLDDVLSELDRPREKLLLEVINKGYQTFITAANTDILENLRIQPASGFYIKNNNALPYEYDSEGQCFKKVF
ncbi:MAG: DNA replication/repair protein RecF [Actinobacteria bacterium]|nr:DNA replication/repair protein RecF [Actinomycetota bacterium]